jgi:signal transduction histidine kinase
MASGERALEATQATTTSKTPQAGDPSLGLEGVNRHRIQMWVISVILAATVAGALTLLAVGKGFIDEGISFDSMAVWAVVVLVVGVTLAFFLYVFEKERDLRRVSASLIEERVRAETLSDQLEAEKAAVARFEELDRLKSDFVATVSHELRTPLTAIIGAAKTIARKGPGMNSEQHAMFLDMIHRQAARLFRLVDDVLTASRIESGENRLRRERLDLRNLAEMAIADLEQAEIAAGHEIVLLTEPDRPEAWGDPDAIQQIFGNLIENALKYSGDSAKVTITVAATEKEALLEVRDDGRGIDEQHLMTIFERFRQAEPSSIRTAGGFGLGLFIVKNLVEAHRGTVDVESEVGVGTAFRVHLPQRSSSR